MAIDATGVVTSPDNIPTYNTAADNPSGKGGNNIVAAIQTALSARLKLFSAPTTTGQVPIWDNSLGRWVPGALSSGPTIYRANGTVDVQNSAALTSVLSQSIPGNTIGANGQVRVRLIGDFLNNSGAGSTLLYKISFGGTTFWSDGSGSIVNAATRRAVILDFTLSNLGATNSNVLGGLLAFGVTSAPTTGVSAPGFTTGIGSAGGTIAPTNTNIGPFASAIQAIDTTSAQTLDVSVQHDSAVATKSFRRHSWLIEVI